MGDAWNGAWGSSWGSSWGAAATPEPEPAQNRGTGGWGAGLNARRRRDHSPPIPLSLAVRKLSELDQPVIAKPSIDTPAVVLNPLVQDDEEELVTLMLHGVLH